MPAEDDTTTDVAREDRWSVVEAERLLAHVMTAETRWFRFSAWLIEMGLRNVPEERASRNPVKWLAAQIGCRMTDAQTRRVNRRLDAKCGALAKGGR